MALLLLANEFYIGIDERDCSVKEMEQKKKKKKKLWSNMVLTWKWL